MEISWKSSSKIACNITKVEVSGKPQPSLPISHVKTLIVGLGNPILGDDGVGWHVAKTLFHRLQEGSFDFEQPEIKCLSLGGLSLMENLVGYDRVILIDAIDIGRGSVGSIYRLSLDDLPDPISGHTGSVHDTSLQTALKMGRSLGLNLPASIQVIAIEAQIDLKFTEILSPPVAKAVPIAADLILNELADSGKI